MGQVIQGQGAAVGDGSFRDGGQPALEDLGFHGADDVQAHGGGKDAAQMAEAEQPLGGGTRHVQPAQAGAEDGGEMEAGALVPRPSTCSRDGCCRFPAICRAQGR